MRKKTAFFLTSIFIVLGIYLCLGFSLGLYFEPVLERTLTRLFGMKVTIDGLYVNAYPGYVRAEKVVFENQPMFDKGVHLETHRLEFRIRFRDLLKKKVMIEHVLLPDLIYYIEREAIQEGPGTNVSMWWKHIKQETKGDGKPKKPEDRWHVFLDHIQIRNGTFIYQDDSTPESQRRFVFGKIEGYLQHFHWPTDDPALLEQTVKLEGMYGEDFSAPFWIKGPANFATGKVGFDLRGEINDGSVATQKAMIQDLPVDIENGIFHLKVHAVCEKKYLVAKNELILTSMKMKMRPGAGEFVAGLPVKAWANFVESKEKTIRLKIQVQGDIRDPDFQYPKAFRKAFQESLSRKIQFGFNRLKNSASGLTHQAKEIVIDAPGKLLFRGGVEKVTDTTHSESQSSEKNEEPVTQENAQTNSDEIIL